MVDDDYKGPKTVVGVQPLRVSKKTEKSPFIIVIEGEHTGMMLRVPPKGRLLIGRDPAADLTLNDSRCSRRHAEIYRDATDNVVLEDLGSTNRTALNGAAIEGTRPLLDGDRISLGTGSILKFSLQDEIEARFQSNLYRSATCDPLTGAYNKRYFLDVLDRSIRHAQRTGSALSLLIFDLDHFKSVNDTHGHLAGDEVLRVVTRDVSTALRAGSTLCRVGGEEFAIILSSTSAEEAALLAERLRAVIESASVVFEGRTLRITASWGVAGAFPDDVPDGVVAAADEALYRAKKEGRNRVCVSSRSARPTS